VASGNFAVAMFQIQGRRREDGELADVVRSPADGLGLHQVPECRGGLERRDDAGRCPVPDRVAIVIDFVLVKKTASLTSRVRARPSSPLPWRPAVSRLVTGTPVPSMAA